MRLPPVGWAFFSLTVLIVGGYVLNRGSFGGSEVQSTGTRYDERVLYAKHCRYLHFSGMKDNAMWSVDSYDQAEHTI